MVGIYASLPKKSRCGLTQCDVPAFGFTAQAIKTSSYR
jgi:hypothetical protein